MTEASAASAGGSAIVQQSEASRRGRANKRRGKAYERRVASEVFGTMRNTDGHPSNTDICAHPFDVEVKSHRGYMPGYLAEALVQAEANRCTADTVPVTVHVWRSGIKNSGVRGVAMVAVLDPILLAGLARLSPEGDS